MSQIPLTVCLALLYLFSSFLKRHTVFGTLWPRAWLHSEMKICICCTIHDLALLLTLRYQHTNVEHIPVLYMICWEVRSTSQHIVDRRGRRRISRFRKACRAQTRQYSMSLYAERQTWITQPSKFTCLLQNLIFVPYTGTETSTVQSSEGSYPWPWIHVEIPTGTL